MSLTEFLIGFSVCLAVLMGYFKVALEKEPFHHTKRVFLLLSVVVSVLIPLVTIPIYIEVTLEPQVAQIGGTVPQAYSETAEVSVPQRIVWPQILLGIYLLGCGAFGFRFFKSLASTIERILKNEKIRVGGLSYVLLPHASVPSAFLQFIFLNEAQYKSLQIPPEVLRHEEIHARQNHALDLIFIELVQIVFWFHPLIYLVKSAMKLNHEFLADQGVLVGGASRVAYQKLLLKFSAKGEAATLANTFNYSFIKRRFIMMATQPKKKALTFKMLALVPLASLLFYNFSSRTEIYQNTAEVESTPLASQEEGEDAVAKYNQLVQQYHEIPKQDFLSRLKTIWRVKDLYLSIPVEEKQGMEPYPDSGATMVVFINEEGKYLLNEREVTVEYLASLFDGLSERERSNLFVIADLSDLQKYWDEIGSSDKEIPRRNDAFVNVFCQQTQTITPEGGGAPEERTTVNLASMNRDIAEEMNLLLSALKDKGLQVKL